MDYGRDLKALSQRFDRNGNITYPHRFAEELCFFLDEYYTKEVMSIRDRFSKFPMANFEELERLGYIQNLDLDACVLHIGPKMVKFNIKRRSRRTTTDNERRLHTAAIISSLQVLDLADLKAVLALCGERIKE